MGVVLPLRVAVRACFYVLGLDVFVYTYPHVCCYLSLQQNVVWHAGQGQTGSSEMLFSFVQTAGGGRAAHSVTEGRQNPE